MSELPAGWSIATLDEVAANEPRSITDGPFGSALKTEHYTASGARVVRLSNIGVGEFLDGDQAYVSLERYVDLADHNVRSGDLITAALGDPLGRTCIAPDGVEPALVKADCFRCRPHSEVDREYLTHWLNSAESSASFIANSHGIGRVRITLSDFRLTKVPVAPAPEQRRIVAKLDALSVRSKRARAELERIEALAERARQAVLAAAFNGRLAGATRGDWKLVPLRDVVLDIRYGTAKKCDRDGSGTAVLRIPNVQRGRIDLSDLKFAAFDEREMKTLAIREGDLLVIRSNGSVSLVGRAALVSPEASGMLFAGYLIRVRSDRSRMTPEFLHMALASPQVRNVIERTAKSTSGVNNINSGEILELEVPCPALDEQEKTVQEVRRLFSQFDRLAQEATPAAELLARLDQSILSRAFRGALVPQDPTDEPASVLLERIRAAREAGGVTPRRRRRAR